MSSFKNIQKSFYYPGWVPVDCNGGLTGNYVSMKNYNHAEIIIQIGACTRTASVTINKAKTVAGGSATQWLTWDEVFVNADVSGYNAEDSTPTTTYTRTTVSSDTKATGTTANQVWVIEFDAIELGAGYDCFNVNISDPGGTGDVIGVLYRLSEPRFSAENPPTPVED